MAGRSSQIALITDVERLRGRGCWREAAELLAMRSKADFSIALRRAEVLVEAHMFSGEGLQDALTAVADAERASRGSQLGLAVTERAVLALACFKAGDKHSGVEAEALIQRAIGIIDDDIEAGKVLFTLGAIREAHGDLGGARDAYQAAYEHVDIDKNPVVASMILRHGAELSRQRSEIAQARLALLQAINLREASGFSVGLAPLLFALAELSQGAEAERLVCEAGRLVRAFGGVPVWLSHLQTAANFAQQEAHVG
jgi:tetratricopeptide (TPR) repeat protein